MNDNNKQQQFILLRAEGCSFARISEQLGVSKPTLIDWGRKFQFDIQNQKAIFAEALQEQWLATRQQRVAALGEQLRKVEAELAKRDLATLSTRQLFGLAAALRREIQVQSGPTQFTTPVSEIPTDERHEQIHEWSA